MRIGIDLDNTITDLHESIIKYGLVYNSEICGNGIKNRDAYEIEDIFDWNKQDCTNFRRYVTENVLQNIEPRDGVCKYLEKIKNEHEIYIITARNNKEIENTYDFTYNWLINRKIPFNKLIIEENDKGKACYDNKINIFVDDLTEHLDKASKNVDKVYIFNNVFNNTKENKKYERLYSFEELYEKIKERGKENEPNKLFKIYT